MDLTDNQIKLRPLLVLIELERSQKILEFQRMILHMKDCV